MKKILSLVVIILISVNSYGQKHSKKTDFSLIIAECFDKDTIDLALNDIFLVDNYIVDSDFSSGTTDLGIYQNKEGLWVQKGRDKQELKDLT